MRAKRIQTTASVQPIHRQLGPAEVELALRLVAAGMTDVGVVALFNNEKLLPKMQEHERKSIEKMRTKERAKHEAKAVARIGASDAPSSNQATGVHADGALR